MSAAIASGILGSRGKVLGNRAWLEAAWLSDEAVRRFGSVRGAALEACASAVSANEVNSDPPAMREEEDILRISRGVC